MRAMPQMPVDFDAAPLRAALRYSAVCAQGACGYDARRSYAAQSAPPRLRMLAAVYASATAAICRVDALMPLMSALRRFFVLCRLRLRSD